MAYRQETRAPSYLEDFLAQIETLPAQLRTRLAELRELDEKTTRLVQESTNIAQQAAKRSTMKGNNVDTLKRQFHQVLLTQTQVTDTTEEKKNLARETYTIVDDVVQGLESSLKDFEKQLRKEGRWPLDENGKAVAAPKTNKSNTTANAANTTNGGGGGGGRSERGGGGGGRSRKKAEIVLTPDEIKEPQKYIPVPLANVEDMPVDPNEPRYCYCNQVSFGEMVACDNKNCPYEWFHFQCVGITETPKGSWRCPDCRKAR